MRNHKFITILATILIAFAYASSTQAQSPWTPVQPTWPLYGPYIPANIYPPRSPVRVYIIDGYGGSSYYSNGYYRPTWGGQFPRHGRRW
jgi:hypothetical protein